MGTRARTHARTSTNARTQRRTHAPLARTVVQEPEGQQDSDGTWKMIIVVVVVITVIIIIIILK